VSAHTLSPLELKSTGYSITAVKVAAARECGDSCFRGHLCAVVGHPHSVAASPALLSSLWTGVQHRLASDQTMAGHRRQGQNDTGEYDKNETEKQNS